MYDTPTTKENLKERALEQIKTEDPLWGHYVAQKIAARVSMLLWRTSLTPHHITILSLIGGCVAAIFFSFGDYTSVIIGALLLNASLILDCCDGHIARLKKMSSHLGGWMDYQADRFKDVVLLLGFAYGAMQSGASEMILVAAFIGIAFQYLRNINVLGRDIFSLRTLKTEAKKYNMTDEKKEVSQFMRSLKHSMFFKISDRVFFFTFFALINQAAVGVMLYALLSVCYAVISAKINYGIYAAADAKKNNTTNDRE